MHLTRKVGTATAKKLSTKKKETRKSDASRQVDGH